MQVSPCGLVVSSLYYIIQNIFLCSIIQNVYTFANKIKYTYNVTLLIRVHKCLLNFWFKRVEDCYIRVAHIYELQRVIMNVTSAMETHGCLFKKTKQSQVLLNPKEI